MGELRFTFDAEDGTSGASVISNTLPNAFSDGSGGYETFFQPSLDHWSYNSETGALVIVLETDDSDAFIEPAVGQEFVQVINVQSGEL